MKRKYYIFSVIISIICFQLSCMQDFSPLETCQPMPTCELRKLKLYIDIPNCILQIQQLKYINDKLESTDTLLVETILISNPFENYSQKNIQVDGNIVMYSINYQKGGYGSYTNINWEGIFEIDNIEQTINWSSSYDYYKTTGGAGQTLKLARLKTSFSINNIPYSIDADGNYILKANNNNLHHFFYLNSYSYTYNEISDMWRPYPYTADKFTTKKYLLNFIEFTDQLIFNLIIYK